MIRVRHRSELLSAALLAAPQAQDQSERLVLQIDTREELINALTEAAELEHGLMLQYLFAALSAKKKPSEGISEAQLESVRVWQAEILRIAREEMAHLGTVTNLLSAVGGSPNFMRPNFPQASSRWYPFEFQLERLGESALERFVRFEQPAESHQLMAEAIAPDPIEFDFVGELYRSISDGIVRLDAELRSRRESLFIGPQEVQDAGDWTGGLRIFPITDVASAQQAIDFIVIEGEGAPEDRNGSHYQRFKDVLDGLRREKAADPDFHPARPVAPTPLTREHRDTAAGYTLIKNPLTRACAELFNHVYGTMLLMLMQYFDFGGETPLQREVLQATARRTMSALVRPLGEVLTTLPVDAEGGETAGPGFEIYGDLRLSSHLPSRWILLQERIDVEVQEARRLSASGDTRLSRLGFLTRNLELLRDGIRSVARGAQ